MYKKIMRGLLAKTKNFIHRHENLEIILLTGWGIFCIIRSYFIFKKIHHGIYSKNYKIIILSVRTIPNPGLIYFDAIFAHIFRKLGCEVKMLFHDNVLDSTDAETVYRGERPQYVVSAILGKLLKKSLNTKYISYKDYITPQKIKYIKKTVEKINVGDFETSIYKNVSVGLHAKASTIRYFLSGNINLDDKNHELIFRKKLANAMISAEVANEIVKKEKPQMLFLLHGIYSTWGPFLEYFKKHGVDTVMYGNMPSRFGHFIFYRNAKVNDIVSKKAWQKFNAIPLTKIEENEVRRYFDLRINGIDGDQKMYQKNFDLHLSKQKLLNNLNNMAYKNRFVMYTNLAWDVYVEGNESAFFNDVFDWIDGTIEFFEANQTSQLIIKPHPGELVWDKCSQSIKKYILQKHFPLPTNIILLAANTPLTAYDLMNDKTTGIVFNGSLGLDMACLGIPVLVTAEIHYKDAGAVYNIKTKEEYFSLLTNADPAFKFTKNNIKLAKKYAYFYYYKSMIRIPFYKSNSWSTFNWNVLRNTEILLDKKAPLMKLGKKIICGEDILNPL